MAACTGGDEPGSATEPGPEAVAEAERLYQIVNDSRAVTDELSQIENRVAKRCMEDEGFQVHDPAVFATTRFAAYGAAGYLTDAPVRAVPTRAAAEQWGFGVWIEFVRAPGNEDLAEQLLTPEARTAFNLPQEDYAQPDTGEWEAQGEAYRAAWIEAYTGSPAVEDSGKGPQGDGEALGGCRLEMIETIYGEPYTVEDEEGDYTLTHPPSPAFELEEFEGTAGIAEHLDGRDVDFESCLIDKGYAGWELGDELYPPLWEYFGQMYAPGYFQEFGTGEDGVPEPPSEIPSDFLGVLELERAVAVDFAECGGESGLRTVIEQAWAAMLVDAYLPIETEMVAWQEQMQGHLDQAQDYLQE
ncbi:hypothetical protein [Glycomyces sp. NRRL B-16210]|uniref:hypothetical protein n=1 Tax=Glycomyces sp. NRRL B-16210 TaxID=1463821 RepID=UPI0004BE57FC|nr:hypothetical protein [Glycomyces sp. NRRL B-16210]